MSQREDDIIYNSKMKEPFEFGQIQSTEVGLLTTNSSVQHQNKCNSYGEGAANSGTAMLSYSDVTRVGENSFGTCIPSSNQAFNAQSHHQLKNVYMYHNPSLMLKPAPYFNSSSAVPLHQQPHIDGNHANNSVCHGAKGNRYIPYNSFPNTEAFNSRRQLTFAEGIYGNPSTSQALVNTTPVPVMLNCPPSSVAMAKANSASMGLAKVPAHYESNTMQQFPALCSMDKKPNSFGALTNQHDSSSTVNSFSMKNSVMDLVKIAGSRAGAGEVTSNESVTLQITNFDNSLDENSLRYLLLNQLKPITPVASIVFEGGFYVKVTVPDLHVSDFCCLAK